MKSLKRGKSTSAISVENITPFGVWMLVGDVEYFLSYKDFPMFLDKPIKSILNVSVSGKGHLRWPEMDVDLELESIKEPQKFPLVDRLAK